MRTAMSTQTMRVIQVYRYGGPEQLKLEEKPRPEPSSGEVLLRVHAAGVNPIDWKIRQGLMKDFMPPTFPYTPGIEVAGVVEDVGPGVTAFQTGQAVFGRSIQLAKWKGAQVIGTASTANLDFVRSLGADTVVDYTKIPVESVVQEVDLVLDGVGAETLSSSLAAIRPGGTLISLAGPPPQEQAKERGVRAAMIHSQPSSALLQTLTQLIDEGRIKVPVETMFPLSEVQQAHEHSQSRHGRGRIVLRITDEAESIFA